MEGLKHAIPEKFIGKSDEVLAQMDEGEMMGWVFADIVLSMVEQLTENKGVEDEFGLGLGIEENDMFNWLKLKE